jgi:hypothetical protein
LAGATALFDQMQRAIDTYRRLLADYEAGAIEERDLRRQIFRAGLIVQDGDAWLLDFAAGRWVHYDGLRVRAFTAPANGQ